MHQNTTQVVVVNAQKLGISHTKDEFILEPEVYSNLTYENRYF